MKARRKLTGREAHKRFYETAVRYTADDLALIDPHAVLAGFFRVKDYSHSGTPHLAVIGPLRTDSTAEDRRRFNLAVRAQMTRGEFAAVMRVEELDVTLDTTGHYHLATSEAQAAYRAVVGNRVVTERDEAVEQSDAGWR